MQATPSRAAPSVAAAGQNPDGVPQNDPSAPWAQPARPGPTSGWAQASRAGDGRVRRASAWMGLLCECMLLRLRCAAAFGGKRDVAWWC
jgi:hypothetical protein